MHSLAVIGKQNKFIIHHVRMLRGTMTLMIRLRNQAMSIFFMFPNITNQVNVNGVRDLNLSSHIIL